MRATSHTLLFLLALTSCGDGPEAPAPEANTAAVAPAPVAPPAAPPAGAASYESLDSVPDAGSLTGTVSYAGSQADATVTPSKDTEVCAHDHADRPAGALKATAGKLENAVVWLPGVERGKAFEPGTVTIDNKDCTFHPHVAIGQVGGVVAATNSDPVLHNTNLTLTAGNKKVANIALPKQGQTIEKPLRKPGIVDVQCDAHEWMQAWIFVADNPYAALTDASGSFTMTDVPPGEYDVKVWHELLGELDASAVVEASGATSVELLFP